MRILIVIPEGLAVRRINDIKEYKLSYSYKKVLDFVIKVAFNYDLIILAPGNYFGSSIREDLMAAEYLKKKVS
jgi:hypothetical protein